MRVHRPHSGSLLPLAVYLHGGAFVLGSLDLVHDNVAALTLGAEAVVMSVAYRLAPEHPFPAGLDDCVSAGATLALGVALRTRDTGGPSPRFLSLTMPALDDRLQTPSMLAAVDAPVWSPTAGRPELAPLPR
ncbi:alpha/beta hydrolase fold domain-containing protein [Frankia sp. R82]|uniref:alpha/beta hydrolase fold domain-containing protein n=1 Tax=Frankia sp. R82 TaxID=2950553 RepID=UPI002043E822|nr:alpha/beta hydrolase fold domain-containing protein [Frankia sp. R82]MCM3884350.1 alpha/beta hydrolase [Frankia sp. R82]